MNIHVLPLNVARRTSTTIHLDTTNSINTTATALLSTHGQLHVLLSFEWCSHRHPYLPMNIHVLPSNVALSAAPSAHGHSRALPSFEICSQQQPYLPMDISVSFLGMLRDIHVSFLLLNVAPSDTSICQWAFMSSPPL
jgi:hypothetical protein